MNLDFPFIYELFQYGRDEDQIDEEHLLSNKTKKISCI